MGQSISNKSSPENHRRESTKQARGPDRQDSSSRSSSLGTSPKQPHSQHYTSSASTTPTTTTRNTASTDNNGTMVDHKNQAPNRHRSYGGSSSNPPPISSSSTRYGSSYGYQERRKHAITNNSTSGGHTYSTRFANRPVSDTTTTAASGQQPKHSQIDKYFMKYKDDTEDAILAEGMEKFCVDLGVDPTEFIVLVLAWKFEASQMCRFTREEFINGCQKMKVHDAKSLRERFPELLAEARRERNSKELYNFTFSFGLDHSTGQRTLPVEMAIPLWNLVFSQRRPLLLDRWFHFLQSTDVRGISRDTWNMFLPFVKSIAPNLSNYDESEAWPSLFDDFVEYEETNKMSSS